MPAVNALGVFACALSPALVLGAVVVFPRPDRMILALTSAFVFVLAFMLTGIVWTVLTPLRGSLLVLAVYATVFQELGRWGMYRCAVWLQRSLVDMRGISEHREASLSSPLAVFGERVAAATAIGVGIAATHGLLLTGRLLKDAASPGSLYVDGCALSRYGLASLVALAFVALQVLWTIYAFVYAFPAKSPLGVALVAGSHLLASSATFLNSVEGHPTLQCGGPTLGLLSVIVLAVGGLTAHAALGCIARLPLK